MLTADDRWRIAKLHYSLAVEALLANVPGAAVKVERAKAELEAAAALRRAAQAASASRVEP